MRQIHHRTITSRSIGFSVSAHSPSKGEAMGYASIVVSPVTPRIGAMVEGITLANPLSNRQVEELHQALSVHQVLFFRDQPMDEEAHKRVGRDRKSTRLNSSHLGISYAVFCLKKKT